jgi:hypothetical protein
MFRSATVLATTAAISRISSISATSAGSAARSSRASPADRAGRDCIDLVRGADNLVLLLRKKQTGMAVGELYANIASPIATGMSSRPAPNITLRKLRTRSMSRRRCVFAACSAATTAPRSSAFAASCSGRVRRGSAFCRNRFTCASRLDITPRIYDRGAVANRSASTASGLPRVRRKRRSARPREPPRHGPPPPPASGPIAARRRVADRAQVLGHVVEQRRVGRVVRVRFGSCSSSRAAVSSPSTKVPACPRERERRFSGLATPPPRAFHPAGLRDTSLPAPSRRGVTSALVR